MIDRRRKGSGIPAGTRASVDDQDPAEHAGYDLDDCFDDSCPDPGDDGGEDLPPPGPPLADTAPDGWAAFELDASTVVPDILTDAMLVDGIVGFERLIGWASARQQELLAAFATRPCDGSIRPVAPMRATPAAPRSTDGGAAASAAAGSAGVAAAGVGSSGVAAASVAGARVGASSAGASSAGASNAGASNAGASNAGASNAGAAARPVRTGPPRDWAADEIGLALHLAPMPATVKLAQAVRLAGVLQPTRNLLQSGQLCRDRTRLITDMLAPYDDTIAAAVQARVLPRAPSQTWGQLRAAITRALLVVVPDPDDRHRHEHARRRVDLYPGEHGMATLAASLRADDATACFAWVTRLARGMAIPEGEKGRGSIDRRRADVLTALLTGRLVAHDPTTTDPTTTVDHGAVDPPDGHTSPDTSSPDTSSPDGRGPDNCGPDGCDPDNSGVDVRGPDNSGPDNSGPAVCHGGRAAPSSDATSGTRAPAGAGAVLASPVGAHRPLIQVTVPITTLLGLDDEPGELAGYGPIPAALAREIAADPASTWRRLLTDPATGALLDYGCTVYRPPASLARHVRARDQVCRYPGCTRPALACELDHVRPRQVGGPTSEANLCALCERHHDLKEHLGWHVVLHPDRSLEWTTPTGHHYSSPPADLGPPTTAQLTTGDDGYPAGEP